MQHHFAQVDWTYYDFYALLGDHTLGNVANDKIWKRTNKAGLEFQTTVRGRTVHFLLDTFLRPGSMDMVVNKTPPHGKGITAGELRWLYRKWSNPAVAGNTKFWTVSGKVNPPWEMGEYAEVWKTYKPAASTSDGSMALASALEGHVSAPGGGASVRRRPRRRCEQSPGREVGRKRGIALGHRGSGKLVRYVIDSHDDDHRFG